MGRVVSQAGGPGRRDRSRGEALRRTARSCPLGRLTGLRSDNGAVDANTQGRAADADRRSVVMAVEQPNGIT
jgi:hypothetical protein